MGTKTRCIALMVVTLLLGAAALALAADEPACPETTASQATAQQCPKADAACAAAVAADPTLKLGICENAKGTVYLYDERRPEAWVTLGTRHGLRPSAVVAFIRNGQVVAQGCVTDARWADCVIAPAPGTPAGQIMLGDDVRVLINGSREAMDAKIRREESDRALGAFAAFAVFFGNIWAARF